MTAATYIQLGLALTLPALLAIFLPPAKQAAPVRNDGKRQARR